MGDRVGAVAGTAAVLFFIVPSVASACDAPSQADLGSVSGRAGETVSFLLPGTPRGAQYAVTVEGVSAGGGTDADGPPGTQASLTIPDLGPTAHDAEAIVSVTCEDGGWQRALIVHYAGRAAAAPPGPGPAPAATPAARTPAAAPATPETRPRTAAPAARRRSRTRNEVKGVRRSFSALGPALLDVKKSERAGKAKERRKRKKRRRKASKRRKLDQDRPARRVLPSVGGGGVDLSGGDISIPGPTIAWRLLAAVALAGLATIALAARRRRRTLAR